jgi:hypothetical protein
MSRPLEFEPEIADEVQGAVHFYAARAEGLADRFLTSLNRTYERIARQPHSYGRIYKSFRAAPLTKYPFAVIYRVRSSVIQVVSIHHLRKGSFDWKHRG